MSDKIQLIKEEIERIIEEETPISKGSDYYHGAKESMEKLLQFINSLPEEPVSEDLEEEIDRYYSDWQFDDDTIYEDMRNICRHFAEWQKRQMKDVLQTEYEKGRFDMREEMMKNAADSKITTDGNSIFPIIKYQLPLTYDCKIGDKVKIIIVKED